MRGNMPFVLACFTLVRAGWTSSALWSLALSLCLVATDSNADESPATSADMFQHDVRPLLDRHCVRCHHADEPTSGVRVDLLDSEFGDHQVRVWERILHQLSTRSMPPAEEPQPESAERQRMIDYVEGQLTIARRRPAPKNGQMRRLTVSQYRNTLRELLFLEEDFTETLPADAVSRDGFVNTVETLTLSPRHLEAFLEIATRAVDTAIVDVRTRPTIECFQVDLGRAINEVPCPDKLVLGANSLLLDNRDFRVHQPALDKPFAYHRFGMRTQYRFIEGYQGNDTVRGWRDFEGIYHNVYACMRGSEGYPKGLAYQVVPQGLLLRPAIPSAEVFEVESTYGPKANFKISVRELPDDGEFRVVVSAAKYNDGLLLDERLPSLTPDAIGKTTALRVVGRDIGVVSTIELPRDGIYRVDLIRKHHDASDHAPRDVSLTVNGREFPGTLRSSAYLAIRLGRGKVDYHMAVADPAEWERIEFALLDESDPLAAEFARFERRSPWLGVHLGLRRDCGSTLTPVGPPQRVHQTDWQEFVFQGAIRDFPSPDVEADNVNYLAGIREIGVRSEYTDGRDMPRLAIRSVRFEGPYYANWPPRSHTELVGETIWADLGNALDSPAESSRAVEVLKRFAARAFRRPTTVAEDTMLARVYEDARQQGRSTLDALKDSLIVVLTSPQFLFLIESSESPAPEPLNDHELAAKLAYFLWDGPPDAELLDRAVTGELHGQLAAQIDRMVSDDRFGRFAQTFARQWLNLEKFAVLEPDRGRFPQLTRDVRRALEQEPGEFLRHAVRENLPISSLIDAPYIVGNEVVANYYGIGEQVDSGFEFVPIEHHRDDLGGLLTQAAILAGGSDGREPNPVKRGAWFARKIIAEPPDDPPPNVPALGDDLSSLPLRVRLERHRDQAGCAQCHAKIDPWGVAFEEYDAGGRRRTDDFDALTRLPDQTEVSGIRDLKAYLIQERLDQIAFGFLKHLTTFATGRSLHYDELELLRQEQTRLRSQGYPMRDLFKVVVYSPPFMEK